MSTMGEDIRGKKGFTPLQIATGFTLIEIVIVLGVIAALAAILVPTLMNYIEDARKARASKDVGIIAAAIAQLNKDTGRWPTVDSNGNPIDCLYTGSEFSTDILESGDFIGTNPPLSFGKAFDHLMRNNANYPVSGPTIWRGPYLSKGDTDPWGTPYAILVRRLRLNVTEATGVYAWILSTGPNGSFETDEASIEIPPGSDDIGILIQ